MNREQSRTAGTLDEMPRLVKSERISVMIVISKNDRKIRIGYIPNDQLRNENGSILTRVGTRCTTCNENKGFTLLVERHTFLPSQNDNYFLQCDNCVERIGLEVSEVTKIERIAKLNEKLKLKKISKEKYDQKIEKLLRK